MKVPQSGAGKENAAEKESITHFQHSYHTDWTDEKRITDAQSGELKSHSFSVRSARYLAGENLIFDPNRRVRK